MIGIKDKVWGLKKEKEEAAATGERKKRESPAEIRVKKDLSELDINATNCKLEFPDSAKVLNFKVILTPKEGIYKGGTFTFTITVPNTYPHEAPKAHCETKIYHPNIDEQGNVCLNILRADWKPVLTIKAVLYGLELLFLEPNPDDPLNREAAKLLIESMDKFSQKAKRWMQGQYY